MTQGTIVSLFDDSANLFDDWIAHGYGVICVDLMPLELRLLRPGVRHVLADLRFPFDIGLLGLESPAVFVSAHPPCSHLAVSGSRWFKGKGLRALSESVAMFATAAEVCEALGAPYMIENPVSTISTYWRKPDHTYDPWQYSGHEPADYYTKRTCLWVGGGFVMPEPLYDRERHARGLEQRAAVLAKYGRKVGRTEMQREQPDYPDSRVFNTGGDLKAYVRSVTPKGFGRAVFLANCPAAMELL